MTGMSCQSPHWGEGHLVFACPCLGDCFSKTAYLLRARCLPGGRSLASVFSPAVGSGTSTGPLTLPCLGFLSLEYLG